MNENDTLQDMNDKTEYWVVYDADGNDDAYFRDLQNAQQYMSKHAEEGWHYGKRTIYFLDHAVETEFWLQS